MGIDCFCKPRKVSSTTSTSEDIAHMVDITRTNLPEVVAIKCRNKTDHIQATGTYHPAEDPIPERIEVGEAGAFWITFMSPTRICYAPAGKSCSAPDITGSWTADDHPIDDGTA